jgi:hypothetical protein
MSGQDEDREAWRAAVRARRAREQDVDKAVDALIQAGMDGALSWAQVDDALTALGYGQQSELAGADWSPDYGGSPEVDEAEERTAQERWMEVEW